LKRRISAITGAENAARQHIPSIGKESLSYDEAGYTLIAEKSAQANYRKRCKLRDRFSCNGDVTTVKFDAHAFITNCLGCGKCRAGSSERVENDPLAEWQNGADYSTQKFLGLEAGMVSYTPLRRPSRRGSQNVAKGLFT